MGGIRTVYKRSSQGTRLRSLLGAFVAKVSEFFDNISILTFTPAGQDTGAQTIDYDEETSTLLFVGPLYDLPTNDYSVISPSRIVTPSGASPDGRYGRQYDFGGNDFGVRRLADEVNFAGLSGSNFIATRLGNNRLVVLNSAGSSSGARVMTFDGIEWGNESLFGSTLPGFLSVSSSAICAIDQTAVIFLTSSYVLDLLNIVDNVIVSRNQYGTAIPDVFAVVPIGNSEFAFLYSEESSNGFDISIRTGYVSAEEIVLNSDEFFIAVSQSEHQSGNYMAAVADDTVVVMLDIDQDGLGSNDGNIFLLKRTAGSWSILYELNEPDAVGLVCPEYSPIFYSSASEYFSVGTVIPEWGDIDGGLTVVVTGSGFEAGATVTFNGASATNVEVLNTRLIQCTTPSGTGLADVVVNSGANTGTMNDVFEYFGLAIFSVTPSSGEAAGGTSVTVKGNRFTATTDVEFDGVAATSITLVDSETITCVTPAGSGVVDVEVIDGSDTDTLANGFSYIAEPIVVDSITPNSGTSAGGTAVTINGSGFTADCQATIGNVPIINITFVNSTELTGETFPALEGSGTFDVTVTDTVTSASGTLVNGYTYT